MERKEFLKLRRQYGKIHATNFKYLKCNICHESFNVWWTVSRHKRRYDHFDQIEKDTMLMASVSFQACLPKLIDNVFQASPLFEFLKKKKRSRATLKVKHVR